MKPRLVFLLGLGVLCALAAFVFVELRQSPPAPAEMFAYQRQAEGAASLPDLWQVPSFSFKDQHGKSTTERDLVGQVWISDFIYTSCTNACPMISAKRALLERKLAGVPLRFVSFSVDPEHDTPEVLAQYADTWSHDDRWLLLSTDRSGLHALTSGMRVAVEATGDPKNPILHSNMFLLIDTKGSVRGVYDSADPEALERLITNAKGLLGNPTVKTTAEATDAEALFTSLSCAACHTNDRIAPPLGGLFGKSRSIAGGAHVEADAAYLKESIVAPGSKVVEGYLNLMPAYGHELSEAQIDSLVAYIQKLPQVPTTTAEMPPAMAAGSTAIVAPPGGSAGAAVTDEPTKEKPTATLGVDPVCKMSVRITASTPHLDLGGHDYYFCSESCRDNFAKNPSQYLTSTQR